MNTHRPPVVKNADGTHRPFGWCMDGHHADCRVTATIGYPDGTSKTLTCGCTSPRCTHPQESHA